MSPLIEEGMIKLLMERVRSHGLTGGTYTDKQIKTWETERNYLLSQLKELANKDAWWSDPEWEWFINRCLNHLGVT